jgi:hypothetical protein
VHARAEAAVQRDIGRAFEQLGEGGMADQPDGEQIARVEGEVEEAGEVTGSARLPIKALRMRRTASVSFTRSARVCLPTMLKR